MRGAPTTPDRDPFPEGEACPLVSEWIEAGAVRYAICYPSEARAMGLCQADIANLTLRAILGSALRAFGRCEEASYAFVVADLKGKVDWRVICGEWLHYDLGDARFADAEHVREAISMAHWRRMRERLLRAAAACERMDHSALSDELELLNSMMSVRTVIGEMEAA